MTGLVDADPPDGGGTLLAHWEGEPVAVWRSLWKAPAVEAHARVGSTNDRARELADAGAAPWTVILAEEQTRGRGRSGDAWHSPPGTGLWVSTLAPSGPTPEPCLPLLAGLAAAEALEAVTGAPVSIKWPNDLLMGGRKVGGILCESGGETVVVGVGLNVRTPEGGFPDELAGVATSAEAEAGCRVSRSALATRLLVGLRHRLEGRGQGKGGRLRPEELEALERRDALAGRRLECEAGSGVGRGLDAGGALRVERPDGSVIRVVAGSVRLA